MNDKNFAFSITIVCKKKWTVFITSQHITYYTMHSYQPHDAYSIFVYNECCWFTQCALCITDRNLVARENENDQQHQWFWPMQSHLNDSSRLYTQIHVIQMFSIRIHCSGRDTFSTLQNCTQSTTCEWNFEFFILIYNTVMLRQRVFSIFTF